MNLEIVILSDGSQRKRNIVQYHLSIESKKKWYKWTYLQNRNRFTDAFLGFNLLEQLIVNRRKPIYLNLTMKHTAAAAAAKSLQSCPTLCDPIDGSPPGSPIPEILQARTLEWVAVSFSNAWKWKLKVKSLSRVRPLRIQINSQMLIQELLSSWSLEPSVVAPESILVPQSGRFLNPVPFGFYAGFIT